MNQKVLRENFKFRNRGNQYRGIAYRSALSIVIYSLFTINYILFYGIFVVLERAETYHLKKFDQ